jgi:peroxiredoxin
MPHIEALHREYGRKGLVVLGVNTESAPKAKAYLEANGITFPTLIDNGGALGRQFQVSGIPTTVLIDRAGPGLHVLSRGRLRRPVAGGGGEGRAVTVNSRCA